MRLQYDCWDCQTAYDDGFGLCPVHRPVPVDRGVAVLPESLGTDTEQEVSGEHDRTTSLSHLRTKARKEMGKS